ncbi:MAG: diaminopimelate decarboxylase, partial [Lachnospiraceae bacterium]|nr:diaminopimelate decarboxylase [Lachnospiraceae bacterium]
MDKRPFVTLEQLQAIDREYPTPYHLYDEAGLRKNVEALLDAFSWNPGYREYFAVKALPTPAILRILADSGCGADCASVPEVLLAKGSGMTGQRIMFTSNETLSSEYQAARDAGAIINVDDLTQVENLDRACGVPETVCCRYNPGKFQAFTNAIIGSAHESKFGM